MQMTPDQARVIDPVLTEVARGYVSDQSPIANVLFPVVSVGQRGGTILVFPPEQFKLYRTVHSPGSNTPRVQFGVASGKYALVDHRLEAAVPVEISEEAAAVPGLDLQEIGVNNVQDLQALEREHQAAQLARNPASYDANNKLTLSGTDKWSDPASNPFEDIRAGRAAIRRKIGRKPNVLALSPSALTALQNHPKVMDRISTSKDREPATIEQLQRLFEVPQIVEGTTTYHDGADFQDVWGQDALLAYTIPAPMARRGAPNFGYTYQLTGRPSVEEGYHDRNTNTWYYPVSDARQPVLAGASAGFLFSNAADPEWA